MLSRCSITEGLDEVSTGPGDLARKVRCVSQNRLHGFGDPQVYRFCKDCEGPYSEF